MAYLPLNSVRNITNAAAKLGGLAFDGVTANIRSTHTITALATSDMSVSVTFLCPASNPVSIGYGIVHIANSATSYGTNAFIMAINASGLLYAEFLQSSGVERYVGVSSFPATYGGKLVTVTFVRSVTGDSGTLYVNGVASGSGGTVGSPVAWSAASFDGTIMTIGAISSTDIFNGPIYSATLFNRALSASEVVTLANQGVQEADKWGSLTAKYSSVFTAGVDTWTISNGTGNAPVTYNAVSDCLSFYANATSGSHGVYRTPSSSLTANKRVKVSFDYAIPAGQNKVKNIGLGVTGAVEDP